MATGEPILVRIFGFYPVANCCITSRPWRSSLIERRTRNGTTSGTPRILPAWRWVDGFGSSRPAKTRNCTIIARIISIHPSGTSEQGTRRVRSKGRQTSKGAAPRSYMVDRDSSHSVRFRYDRVSDGRLGIGILAIGKSSW